MISVPKVPDDDDLLATKQQAVEEARAEMRAGLFVAHEVVKEWLQALARGEDKPAPL